MRRPALVWVGVIVGLLALDVVVQGTLLVVALGDPSFAVEPDYEWQAEHWDEIARERAASRELGWSVDLRTEPAARPGAVEVRVRLADRTGAPVRGADVELGAFHNARASRVVAGRLPAVDDGLYGDTLALDRPGLWEFRVRVTRGAERYSGRFRASVAGTRP